MTIVNQRKLMDRVSELVADGYLIRGQVPNVIILTPKGLSVLLAFGERPIKQSEVTPFSLPLERERTERNKKAEGK